MLKAQKYYIFWISLHISVSACIPNFKTSVQQCNLLWYIKALHRWRKRICALYALPKWLIRHLSSFWWLLWFNNFSYSKWSFCPRQKPAWHSLGPPFTSCCLFLQACVSFMGMHGDFSPWSGNGVLTFRLLRRWPHTLLFFEQKGQAAGYEFLSCPFTVVWHGVLMSAFPFPSIDFCITSSSTGPSSQDYTRFDLLGTSKWSF